LKDTETLAGSTLTQDVALRFALREIGLSPIEAVTAVTLSPARALGLEGRIGLLRPGFVADAVLLNTDWVVERVWGQGECIL
jgi:N-acetylglucosamine-6-phosphate deacetylase